MKMLKLNQKITSLVLSLAPLFSSAAMIPLAVATIPLVVSQPAHAFAIYGDIFDKWAIIGGDRSVVGTPTSDELPAARGGRYNSFQNGFIYWHPNFGAHTIYGNIGVKWVQAGRENGFGYPSTDELPAANGGRYNQFEGGRSYIYWHPKIGTFAVYGDIAQLWNSKGRERSRLGYPISDEQPAGTAGQRMQHFQGGSIYWNSGSRKMTTVYGG